MQTGKINQFQFLPLLFGLIVKLVNAMISFSSRALISLSEDDGAWNPLINELCGRNITEASISVKGWKIIHRYANLQYQIHEGRRRVSRIAEDTTEEVPR